MLDVKIKSERENFQMPVMGSKEAACFDVYASKIEKKEDGLVIVYLGFSTEIPKGWKGVLVPRSNVSKTGWSIPNSPGTIDSDYRGEWQARFRPNPVSFGEKILLNDFPYKVGERVAQINFEKVEEVTFREVNETNETVRGTGGHGHTGLK